MSLSYLEALGHIVVATHGAADSGGLVEQVGKGGFAKDRFAKGEELAATAEKLVRKKVDHVGEDRTREHAYHAATQELEMWLQTVHARVKREVEEESAVELTVAKKLHAHDHGVTVVARVLRAQAMLRCDDRVSDALGGADAVREILNRGHALAKKLYRASAIRLAPEGDEVSMAVFEDLDQTLEVMNEWVVDLATAAVVAAEKDLRLLGRLGLVPSGVGIPIGGTSFAVVLHERGQTDAPDPRNVRDCPGWSVGRQGRNKENLGKGWAHY